MQDFAQLLDRLLLTPARNGKLRLLEDFWLRTPDPDRGWALAAITGELDLVSVKPAGLRAMVAERMDAELFAMSHDYVGDMAETIALVWDNELRTAATGAPVRERPRRNAIPSLSEVVETLRDMTKPQALAQVEEWLDVLDASARYALLKLVTGGLRIGVSARLAKQSLANIAAADDRDVPEAEPVDISEIEELWHGLEPPYASLFAWLLDGADKPVHAAAAPFRPVMLSTAIEEPELAKYDPADYACEWKWDGIRVQVTKDEGVHRMYSRTGDDISRAFPDLMAALDRPGMDDATIDGELLVGRRGPEGIVVGTFSDLQQRLNRKTVTKKAMSDNPVFVRAYDLLFEDGEDLRALPFRERRARLESFVPTLDPDRFDLSHMLEFDDWRTVVDARAQPHHPIIEGIMLKRWDSAYVPGRPRGPWFKWKRDPFAIDAVMMYAQRGHGKRSSYYSDYTFGVWKEVDGDDQLVPVGKAYFGFTDEELRQIDRFVRNNTTERFGPVRGVTASKQKGLVLEVAFEGLQRSPRHKSGVAMRFPRVSRLRWDKPPAEADRIEALEDLLAAQERKAAGVEAEFRQVARKG